MSRGEGTSRIEGELRGTYDFYTGNPSNRIAWASDRGWTNIPREMEGRLA